jgi:hypothetical protein
LISVSADIRLINKWWISRNTDWIINVKIWYPTTQHRSTCSFIQQFKNNVDILRIGGSARMNYSLALLRLSTFEIWTSQAHRFRRWLFSIYITPTVQKSNLAAEQRNSSEGCTVRLETSAEQSSLGVV